ncbi:MAG TPA: YncE family protein [Rhizomicrobium sp.]|nr:YncE family protein [Rhizomicrobium sp.]
MKAKLAALFLCIACPAFASQDQILVGLDNTMTFGAYGKGYRAPGHDRVLVLDASNPARPKIVGSLPLSNSIQGPPTNLQITPNGSLGLVASSIIVSKVNGQWQARDDNRVHLIDLSGATPHPLGDLRVGKMPSGIAISRDGSLALVANYASKSVSVLRILGNTATPVAEVAVGDAVNAVAITPDGTRAFVTKPLAAKIGVINLSGTRATYNLGDDVPAGFNPYNIAVTPDGIIAIAVNNTAHGNSASLTVIDAVGPHPHSIDTVSLGDGPEGFAMAPDGRSAAVQLLHGGTSSHNDWTYHRNGGIVGLKIDGRKVTVRPGEIAMGSVPEGIAYSRDGRYLYAADFNDKLLHVIAVRGGRLRDTGRRLRLPGPPASMRGVAF